MICISSLLLVFFFFNDSATTEIYTLSLHDALPILAGEGGDVGGKGGAKAKIATNEQAALYNPKARQSLSSTPAARYVAWRQRVDAQKPTLPDDPIGQSNRNR